jgi:branched-subunit amino acid transport protein
VVAAILAMAAVTYACRAGGYAILRVVRPPRFVERMLQHLPGCIFVAFLVPALAPWGAVGLAGAAGTALVMWKTRSLTAAILGGSAVVAGLRALGA